jgi:peptidoglycan hydrolase CwlO-like protein
MKTKTITTIVTTLAIVSLCMAGSVGASPKSDAPSHCTVEEVHAEVQKTQAELQQALSRISQLEMQVSSLQKANAKLESAMQRFGQPRLVPLAN